MNKDIVRITIVTLTAVCIRIICTPIFGRDPISSTQPFGNVAGLIGIIPSVIIMFIIAYFHLSLVGFYVIRNQIAGNYKNGFLFGLLVGLIWLYGMFEAGILKNISQYKEILFGISEAIPIIFLGLLLSYTLRKEKIFIKQPRTTKNNKYIKNVIIVVIVSVTYLLFRYISYSLINIESQFINKPISTFIWTLGNGILISILYIFFKSLILSKGINSIIILFCILFFGIDWFIYNMFVPIFFNVPCFEIIKSFIIRSLMDIIGVGIGIYITEVMVHKNKII